MILSKQWLAQYVDGPDSAAELAERLALAGLNHESSWEVGSDTAVEIEVTSNRPDWLGHLGVAREVAVLWRRPLRLPDVRLPAVQLPEGKGEASSAMAVEIAAPELCPHYSARVIRGVTIGPSPDWLVERLRTVGVTSVNNVVDVTNYVMLECGQPLHAFDLARIAGGRIIVRRAVAGEPFEAINHKTYTLADTMCVIADARRPVALAGVMGGAETEIRGDTTDVLLESAQFAPLAVRAAARGLALASASSYRFERGPDPAMVEWASRRAAALILEVAGGRLEGDVVMAGTLAVPKLSVLLAPGRVAAVLGVDVPAERQREILAGLGFVAEPPATGTDTAGGTAPTGDTDPTGGTRWRVPSWRRDVTREIDLVEEVARIEGYDRVPENVAIAARPVEWSDREQTVRRVGEFFVGAGFCEAMTRSVVTAALEETQSPWTDAAPLTISPPLVRGADRLRRSLLPSLLEARAGNEAVGAPHGELFEIARGYVARPGAGKTPARQDEGPLEEPLLAACVTGGDFFRGKGIAEAVLAALGVTASAGESAGGHGDVVIDMQPVSLDLFTPGRTAEILLRRQGGVAERIGVVGEVAAPVLGRVAVAAPVTAVELRLDRLEFAIGRDRVRRRPSDFPAVQRDVNLVVAADVPWADVEAAIRVGAGELLEGLKLVQVWEDAERLGAGKKSFVVALRLRSTAGTLSGEEAARAVAAVVASCAERVGASLRASSNV
jgi:phenylalanyl-tRNA synthetase beta chain